MSLVVPQFIDETYPDEVVFLAVHVEDAAEIPWTLSRKNEYGVPGYPDTIFGCALSALGRPPLPPSPPSPWISRVETLRLNSTDITMALHTSHVSGDDWRFSTRVCMEPTGTARTVRTYVGYTIDDWPPAGGYRYRATLRNVGAYEDLALNPGDCVDVDREFTLQAVDLAHFETIVGVAWTQTPSPGFGEAYQAAKRPITDVFDDGFESGDFSAWSVAQP